MEIYKLTGIMYCHSTNPSMPDYHVTDIGYYSSLDKANKVKGELSEKIHDDYINEEGDQIIIYEWSELDIEKIFVQ